MCKIVMSQLEFWFCNTDLQHVNIFTLGTLNKIQQSEVTLEDVMWNGTGSHETTENTYHWHLSLSTLIKNFPCKLHLSFSFHVMSENPLRVFSCFWIII